MIRRRLAPGRGVGFLYERYGEGRLTGAEPIGLYFSRLWYSEEMYNITFVLGALKKLKASGWKG